MQEVFLKQSDLVVVIRAVFPEYRVISNSRKQSDVVNPQYKKAFELDVWLPEINLAFEFQDPYHYISTGIFRDLPTLQQRDKIKKAIAEKKGITLITIPCWWDGKNESLAATVRFYRKDLLLAYKDDHSPIPTIPPQGYFDNIQGMAVPGIGDLMSSSSTPPAVITPLSWWISEKYDGCRAFWHHVNNTLYTRWGKKLGTSDDITSCFPKIHLDGEIWAGRGLFEKAMQTTKQSEYSTWDMVRFVAFDTLESSADESVFETRLRTLFSYPFLENSLIVPAVQLLCKSKRHMRENMESVMAGEGEGIILRKIKSVYEKGRSTSLVKLKAIRDQEALCVEVLPEGYLLKLSNDITFMATLKTTEENSSGGEIEKPNPGDIVTFKFKYYSINGQPNSAEILHVRKDMSWDDVVRNDFHSPAVNKVNKMAVVDRTTSPRWELSEADDVEDDVDDDVKATREFLNKFAMDMGRDPLVPSSWYDVNMHLLASVPGGSRIFKRYGSNIQNLLFSVYPNIGLDVTRFGRLSGKWKFWEDKNNIKKYLDEVANKNGFDPLVPSNWYRRASLELFSEGKGYILARFGGYKKVLELIYGEYGVKESMFDSVPMGYYSIVENRKKYFEKLVEAQGLDPKSMEDWYSLSNHFVFLQHGGQHMLRIYKRSMMAVVQDIFPNHKWDESRFKVLRSRKQWNTKDVREYFDSYAKRQNFDPLVAENWYSITRSDFKDKIGRSIVNRRYEGSFKKAVKDIYPEVQFNYGLFTRVTGNYWKNKTNARMFFDTLAKKRGFDPLQAHNWYNLPRHVVQAEKGGKAVLPIYGGSLLTALSTLYPEIAFDYRKFPNSFQYKKRFVKDR